MNLRLLLLPPLLSGRYAVALLALRILVGAACLVHGSGKAADLGTFAAEFGIPPALAAGAAYAQVAGGVLLILGLATPAGAATIAGTMAVATLKLAARGEPWINPHGHSFEPSLFYFVTASALLLLGPGAFSVDALLLARLHPHTVQPQPAD